MNIPTSHPRYHSLMTRERMVDALKAGIIVPEGLIAHGRGEAYDYILGERTGEWAKTAIHAAAHALVNAVHPVISVNGNAAALCPEELAELAKAVPAKLEVNLFHRSEERIRRIADHLRAAGADDVLGEDAEKLIDGIEHSRAYSSPEGIVRADVVLVPLEDGDRAEALKQMGKTVITVDLNPLSRTASTADITIVDNLLRALSILIEEVNRINGDATEDVPYMPYDNHAVLLQARKAIAAYLTVDAQD